MCGIAGIIGDMGLSPDDRQPVLERMLAAIQHRGPDEQGLMVDAHVAIGNVRLAIIDIAHGLQPMHSADERFWIVFNGEIFNYIELGEELRREGVPLETQSDTEVLLQGLIRHGADFLPRLNGQFAFVFHDRESRETLIARDRSGICPLFHTRVGGALLFASEVKAFLPVPGFEPRLDAAALGDVVSGWAVVPGGSPFAGVSTLPPGAFARLKGDRFDVDYFDRTIGDALAEGRPERPFAETAAEIRERLERAVELRLRADIEVGSYVSGGLDSTLIALSAQRLLGERLKTFSIRFQDAAFDEGSYQNAVIDALGSEHTEHVVSPEDYAGALERAIWHAETPLYRLAAVPMLLLSGRVRENGMKVVLTGEGADEVFLGYDIYKETLVRAGFENSPAGNDEKLAAYQRLYPYLEHFRGPQAAAAVAFFNGCAGDPDDPLYGHRPRRAMGELGLRLLTPEAREAAAGYDARLLAAVERRHPGFRALSALDRAVLLENENFLPGYLLCSQGDRMVSANAVEGRYPFTDPDLVAAACRAPRAHLLTDDFDEKHVLKEAFREILPEPVLNRPKYPYRAPDAALLTDGEAVLPSAAEIEELGLFDVRAVERFMKRLSPERAGQREVQALSVVASAHILHRQFNGGAPALSPLTNLRRAARPA